MKLAIQHETVYTYDAPVRSSTQYIRLTPRENTRQRNLEWRIDTPIPATQTLDGYGNVLHVLTLDRPVSEIRIRAHGIVQTRAPDGENESLSPSDAGFPANSSLSPLVFRRATPVTSVDKALAKFAHGHRKHVDTLAGLRDLANAIADRMALQPGDTGATISAAEAFGEGALSVRDQAHVFIACCRHLGVPARFVSGYMHSAIASTDGLIAGHAWAQAWVCDQWHSFDLATNWAENRAHLALAVGADYLDACPIRGVRIGGGIETMLVQARISVSQ